MKRHQLELALRKQRLLVQSAHQREQMALYAGGMRPLLATADKAVAGALWVKQHPAVLAVSSAALFILRPRFLVRLAMRGYSAWRLVQVFRGRQRH
ncbi:MAG: YqjK-like family protein [Rhodocyclaceae bacterium]|nr:YqjK-like family protein [Rhodocyclaceae bacterium]